MASGEGLPAIVLAAGLSARFGPGNKLSAEVEGVPILELTLRNLDRSRCGKIHLVLGHGADEIKKLTAGLKVTRVLNPDFKSGIGSSIRQGIKSLAPGTRGTLIALADMPLVKPETVDRLLLAHEHNKNKKMFVPVFEGRKGNPVLWDKALFANLLALPDNAGGKAIIERTPEAVAEVPVDDPGVLTDVDSPNDLSQIQTLCRETL